MGATGATQRQIEWSLPNKNASNDSRAAESEFDPP